jgi:hypothetical protein
MRTIRIAIVGFLLSLVAVTSAPASPFTAIGLPLVFGQEPPPPTASQSSSLWVLIIETTLGQLRIPETPRIMIDEATQAELFGEIPAIAPAQ